MLTIARRTVGLWWQTWPWLLAIYLVGWFVRFWVLHGAVTVGLAYGPLWGGLVLAVVPMVRLLMYLAMFLVIRSAAPGLQHVDGTQGRPTAALDVVLAAILPFLVIYTAWKLVAEDFFAYATAVSFTTVYEGSDDAVARLVDGDFGFTIWVVIVVAFTLRQLLTRFRDRLPRWTMLCAVYFEVVWLFLTLQASAAALFGTPKWISERRIIVWYSGIREQVFDRFALLGHWWGAIGEVLGLLLPVLGISLAWLAIAGVVYGTPLPPTWGGARKVFLGHRGDLAAGRMVERSRRVVQPRWQRVPGTARDRVLEFLRGQLGRFAPVVDAARLILHGGLLPIAFFVAAFTALVLLAPSGAYFDATVTDGYLWRGLALLIGPQEWLWWQSYEQTIRLVIGAVIEPIRICLVAATYWYCVDQIRNQQSAGVEADHQR